MHSAMCFACTAQGGASGLNAETLVWLQFDIDMRFTIALVQTGRGSYAKIRLFWIDYKRSSPETWAENPEDCCQKWGPRALESRLDWFTTLTNSNLVLSKTTRKCSFEHSPSVGGNPSATYSMASQERQSIRVQLEQAMSALVYPEA